MKIHGWGLYPNVDAKVTVPLMTDQCISAVADSDSLIARGLGRSYGDSSLALQVVDTHSLDHFIAFDEATGLLKCAAGVSLGTIIAHFLPKGWFLPVTPGTCFVTVGGAIASDVHGKNHHLSGTFSNHIKEIEILLGNGEQVITSPTQHADLFHASCGGMGLTGIILSATLCLIPVKSSHVLQTTIKAPNLDAILEAFQEHESATYSVAWIDCLARGKDLGRSVLTIGEHAQDNHLTVPKTKAISVPFVMPSSLLNHTTVSLFNALFYATKSNKTNQLIPFDSFFYPLDKIYNWNRLYGKAGFVQYQFVLPLSVGVKGLREILTRIADSGSGSFLAVLKMLGQENANYLSFPLEGYTLALDFKVTPSVFILLDQLDKLVLQYGGRLYLTKDARMSESMFKEGYPRWQAFEEVRAKYGAIGKFASLQSKRIGLQ